MTVSANLSGVATITNESGGVLALMLDIIVNNSLVNNAGGIVNVSGTNTIGAITSPGTMNFTILNDTTFDALNSTAAVNLDGGTINVTSSFTGNVGNNYQWDIITGTSLTAAGTTVTLPVSGIGTWSNTVFGGNTLRILYSNGGGGNSFAPTTGFNSEVAAVINNMANNITNPGQQTLVNAFAAASNDAEYNSWLQQMIPNLNTNDASINIQDPIHNRVETRIASLGKRQSNTEITGISVGDINPHTAMWVAGFGSVAKQGRIDENPGYKSESFGGVVGIDTRQPNNGVLGFGLAASKVIVKENSNPNFVTDIIGYHGLAYASKNLKYNTFFEWMLNAAVTTSDGSRAININNTVMSTTFNYLGAQAGFRLNYGKHFNTMEVLQVSPLLMMQYIAMYVPDYDETYSPAALHVTPQNFQNILTLGAGTRITLPTYDWWLLGTREIRAMVTYDVLSSDNLTTSNFLVGSNDFSIATTPERLALKLGADFYCAVFKNVKFHFSYDYEIRKDYHDNAGTIKVKYVF
jgi:hypothetical protein